MPIGPLGILEFPQSLQKVITQSLCIHHRIGPLDIRGEAEPLTLPATRLRVSMASKLLSPRTQHILTQRAISSCSRLMPFRVREQLALLDSKHDVAPLNRPHPGNSIRRDQHPPGEVARVE